MGLVDFLIMKNLYLPYLRLVVPLWSLKHWRTLTGFDPSWKWDPRVFDGPIPELQWSSSTWRTILRRELDSFLVWLLFLFVSTNSIISECHEPIWWSMKLILRSFGVTQAVLLVKRPLQQQWQFCERYCIQLFEGFVRSPWFPLSARRRACWVALAVGN